MTCEIRQGTTPARRFVLLQADGSPAPTDSGDAVLMTLKDPTGETVIFRDRAIVSIGQGAITDEATGASESYASGVVEYTPEDGDDQYPGECRAYFKALGESFPTSGYEIIIFSEA